MHAARSDESQASGREGIDLSCSKRVRLGNKHIGAMNRGQFDYVQSVIRLKLDVRKGDNSKDVQAEPGAHFVPSVILG